MRTILITCLACWSYLPLSAQWNWPEDQDKAKLHLVTYTDYFKIENYRESANALQWLLVNAPDLNPSIYQNGVKIYEGLAKEETGKKKTAFLDSALWMYDQRMAHFGDSVNVMNRKSFAMYKHFHREPGRYKQLLEQFDATFEVSGNQALKNNLLAYMNVVKLNKRMFNQPDYEGVLERYNTITSIIAGQEAEGADLARQEELIDKVLIETIPEALDCDFVLKKMRNSTMTIDLAENMYALMQKAGCQQLPEYMDLAVYIDQSKPSYWSSRSLGKRYVNVNDDSARYYFERALAFSQTDEERVNVTLDLARIAMMNEDFAGARRLLKQAIQIEPDNKNALNGLGNLYFHGTASCMEKQSKVVDRLPYLAAFTYYERASNKQMMHASMAQFPSMEAIFLEDRKEGETMHIDCWIQEDVTLKARPSL